METHEFKRWRRLVSVSNPLSMRQDVRDCLEQMNADACLFISRMPPQKRYAFGGGDKSNWQNFRRGGEIRKSIIAPPGFKLCVVDARQVECRGLNWLSGEQWVLEAFRQKRDLYSEVATRFYQRQITEANKLERHLGKTIELGCGFGQGPWKFQTVCRQGALGGPPIILTDVEATAGVKMYRDTHPCNVSMWGVFGKAVLPLLASGGKGEYKCLKIADHRIYLPNGAALNYEGLYWGYYDGSPQPDEMPQWVASDEEGQ